jgi:cytochrome b
MIMNDSTHNPHPIRVWDLPVRVFHWALAISFGGAYLLAESERLRQVHVMFGYTVLGLIAFRFLWGFIGTRYARFSSFLFGPRAALSYVKSIARGAPEHHVGHNPIGSYAVYAILILGVLTGISGYCTLNDIGGDATEELHEAVANAWLAVVIVHIAGVVISSVLHRENLVRAMVTGYKRAAEPAADSPQSSPARVGVGILAALAVLTFWVGSLLTGGLGAARDRVDSTVAEAHEGDED